MISFPLYEIYYAVLCQKWNIRELWRKNGEIRVSTYLCSLGLKKFIEQTGMSLDDVDGQMQHLEYSLYKDEE